MKSTKYHRVVFYTRFIAFAIMSFNKDSVMANHKTYILYLGDADKNDKNFRISFGWIGNCHPFYLSFTNHGIEFSSNYTTTNIYRAAKTLKLSWNSEHIAKKYGVYVDNTDDQGIPRGGGPEGWYSYEGWLGNHHCL